MMLTRGMAQTKEVVNRQWWLSAILALVLLAVIGIAVVMPVWGPNGSNVVNLQVAETTAGVAELGIALVDGNQYVLPFEIASLLLTAAMIGAIVVARDD